MMPSAPTRSLLVFAMVALTACASAGKRLEQGAEAEARGNYAEAALRYIEALEKDATLREAREALLRAWDSALADGLREAALWQDQSDDVAAADEFRTLEMIRANASAVGVPLAAPTDYPELRRAAFDGAIAALTDMAVAQRNLERWRDARSAYRRIRDDYDPSPSQRQDAIEGEVEVLLDWSGAEAMNERYQSSYRLATEALGVSNQIPSTLVNAATDLQERALGQGLRVLAVFPVEIVSDLPARHLPELGAQLTDVLDRDHWRRPPYFVAVADPAAVRQATRRMSPPGVPLRPGRILDAVGADFGALLQVTDVQVVEDNLKRREVTARTRDGRRATYHVEEGRASYTVIMKVTLFYGDGLEMESFQARSTESGRFERGVYGGDPQNLDIPRGERRLFDRRELQVQRGAVVDDLVSDLAGDVAGGVFDRVLRRIP